MIFSVPQRDEQVLTSLGTEQTTSSLAVLIYHTKARFISIKNIQRYLKKDKYLKTAQQFFCPKPAFSYAAFNSAERKAVF